MKKFSIFLLLITPFLASQIAFAKVIHLLEQPKTESKVVGTVDSNVGVISIYTPKDNKEWTKVADPRNGNVGWIKSSDLSALGFSVNVIKTGDGKNNYQVIQFGNTSPYTSEQLSTDLQKLQLQQNNIQKNIRNAMDNLFKEMNQEWQHFPTLMPVIVVPEKSTKTVPVAKPVSPTITPASKGTTTTNP